MIVFLVSGVTDFELSMQFKLWQTTTLRVALVWRKRNQLLVG